MSRYVFHMAVALLAIMSCATAGADSTVDSGPRPLLNKATTIQPNDSKFNLRMSQNVCVCGYQSYNICKNGHVYSHSFCRDQNGQNLGKMTPIRATPASGQIHSVGARCQQIRHART